MKNNINCDKARKSLEQELNRYEQLYKAYQEVSTDCLLYFDRSRGRLVYSSEEDGRQIKSLEVGEELEAFETAESSYPLKQRRLIREFLLKSMREAKRGTLEFTSIEEDGAAGKWYRMEVSPGKAADGRVTELFGRIQDIDKQVRERERLTRIAKTDTLTGLMNRSAIMERIDDAVEHNCPSALLMLDIDNFKEINEVYGHWFGDYILRAVADVAKNNAVPGSSIGRIGNDEFLLLFPTDERDAVAKAAEEILKGCGAVSKKQNLENKLTFSIGIARFPRAGQDRELLFDRADRALFAVKNDGRGGYAFYLEVEKDKLKRSRKDKEPESICQKLTSTDELDVMIRKLFAGGRKPEEALQEALRMIGCRMGLDKVSIMEFDHAAKSVYCGYQWQVQGMSSEKEGYLSYSKNVVEQFEREYEDTDGKIVVADIEKEDLTNIYRFSMKKKGLKAGVHYDVKVNEFTHYCFQFESYTGARSWTQEETGIFYEVGGFLALVLSEFREKNRMEDFMERFVNYDSLTRLYNYSKFLQEAELARLRGPKERYIIIYTDFRNFKYINDTFGYHTGDRILCEFADTIRELGISCRVANDCFATLYQIQREGDIEADVARVNQELTGRLREQYPGINVILDSGIYYLKPEDEMSVAMDNANYARKMVKSGSQGGSRLFDEGLQDRLRQEAQMFNALDSALNRKEFQVYFQPKVSLHNRRLTGAEALIRWQKPDGAMVYPDEFIPFCEENNLIDKLDLYVLRETCRTIQGWIREGTEPVCVSVNLSRYECVKEGFFEQIMEIVNEYGVPHGYLEFEVTESVFQKDVSALTEFLEKLRAENFDISIDDFGSGYSSLNILPDMPVTVIKLDRDFWKKENNEKRNILLMQIIGTMKLMGFRVICEGIELPEQAEFCRKIGCDMAQGYLFGRPVPIREFEELMKENRTR